MARNTAESEADKTLGTIIKELTEDFSTLFRSEVALLKLEVKETVTKLGGGIGMFAGAVFLALFGLAFAFVTIVLGLVALGVPAWVSTLIVTIVLFVVAGILAFLGKKKFAALQFVPSATIETVKNDIESLKADVARVRSR
jgi:uncharacterized membrane protein YqjE